MFDKFTEELKSLSEEDIIEKISGLPVIFLEKIKRIIDAVLMEKMVLRVFEKYRDSISKNTFFDPQT